MKVVIVGGVAGGASAAARLRRLDERAEIVMFERGEHISFANCGLPYYIGGEIKEKSALLLQTPQSFRARFNVDVRVFCEVIAVDREKKRAEVKNLLSGETYFEEYDKLILAPGAEPRKIDYGCRGSARVFTLRNTADTYRIDEFIAREKPRTAVIVGGGYIGVEMAENLKLAGLNVVIAEMSDQLLPPLDFDMACEAQNYLLSKGVEIKLNCAVSGITETNEGLKVLTEKGELWADMVVSAPGVTPESGLAKSCGLELGERGGIVTDEHMRTNDPDIYAAGDAVEVREFVTGERAMIPLAGPANKQGRIAADNICGIASVYKGTQGSSIVKLFDMTAASTGINEKQAKRLGIEYEKSFTYSPDHATYYPGAANMSVKTLFDQKSGKILGTQIVGFQGVDKRADIFAVAIRAGMTAKDLTELELCYAPPFSSAKDPVNMAGFAAENILSGGVKVFHWHDISALQKRKDVILLDVRTEREYAGGRIEGFINIPLDSLRGRMGELDKAKPIYVHCHSGMRSYLACRILKQNGFDCYNLSGGYRLYHAVVSNAAKLQ